VNKRLLNRSLVNKLKTIKRGISDINSADKG